jgi:hypothetical protein
MRRRLGSSLLAVLGVVPCAGVCGCRGASSNEPSAASSSSAAAGSEALLVGPDTRVHPPGELGHAHDFSMSVESVKDCLLDAPFAARDGSVKVGVEVALEGTTALEVPVNPFYATLHDASGETYTSTLAGCEPSLPSIRLTSGKKARGFVTFEVPKTARHLELHYAPLVIGPGVEELRFQVVR